MKSLRKVKVSSLTIDQDIKDILIKILGEDEYVYIQPLENGIRIIL